MCQHVQSTDHLNSTNSHCLSFYCVLCLYLPLPQPVLLISYLLATFHMLSVLLLSHSFSHSLLSTSVTSLIISTHTQIQTIPKIDTHTILHTHTHTHTLSHKHTLSHFQPLTSLSQLFQSIRMTWQFI